MSKNRSLSWRKQHTYHRCRSWVDSEGKFSTIECKSTGESDSGNEISFLSIVNGAATTESSSFVLPHAMQQQCYGQSWSKTWGTNCKEFSLSFSNSKAILSFEQKAKVETSSLGIQKKVTDKSQRDIFNISVHDRRELFSSVTTAWSLSLILILITDVTFKRWVNEKEIDLIFSLRK